MMCSNDRRDAGLGLRLLPPRFAGSLFAIAKLLCIDKPRPQQFAAPPRPDADPHHRAAGGEGKPEHFGHRQRADVEADPALGNIDDEALDPWRVRRRNDKARPPHLHPVVLTISEILAMSRHAAPPLEYRRAKPLSGRYGKKLTTPLREPESGSSFPRRIAPPGDKSGVAALRRLPSRLVRSA